MTEQETRRYLRQMKEEDSQTALQKFYDLCFDRFFRIAYYYLKQEEWAQEVVLDVFMKIWEKRESLQTIVNLEDYFFITVKNAALNYLAKEERQKQITEIIADKIANQENSPGRNPYQRRTFFPLCQSTGPSTGKMPGDIHPHTGRKTKLCTGR